MGYEYVDISGDAGLRAEGDSLKELFESSALGMYSLMADLEEINEEFAIDVEIESHSIEGLLVEWLNELVYHFDAEGFVGKEIVIDKLDGEAHTLSATVMGEEFDPERHEGNLLIKAATYHNLKVEEEDGRWTAEIIFDI